MTFLSKPLRMTLYVPAVALVLAAAAAPEAPPHERKIVAGLQIVFGAEPEPAITDEVQLLVWRISDVASKEPFTELEDAQVTVTFEGETFGPFPLRPVRGEPGRYQTRHIFTEVGSYGTVLRFRKGEDSQEHTVDFEFRIRPRSDLELPGRRRGG